MPIPNHESRVADPAHRIQVFDGHNDTLVHLRLPHRGKGRSFFERSHVGHLDLPRAREGGFAGGLFSLFTPSARNPLHPTEPNTAGELHSPLDHEDACAFTKRLIGDLLQLENQSNGELKVVRTGNELDHCIRNEVIAAVMHLEGAEAVAPDLSNLQEYYELGLRTLGIAWARQNGFGRGVPLRYRHTPNIGPGLTAAGKELVRACTRLGIAVDLAHINEQGFWDAATLTEKPIVVSHSAAYGVIPSARNLTDRQLDAVGESGGIVGVDFIVADLREDGRVDPDTPLSAVVDHIEYIANRIGIDHVGLGSDFDGAKIPRELKDVTGLQTLMQALRDRCFDDDALRKVARDNWIRVLKATWTNPTD